MQLRKAKQSDSKQLIKLLKQLGYNVTEKQLTERMRHNDVIASQTLFVIEAETKIIGFVAFIHYQSFVFGKPCVFVDSIVVDQDHRSQGVGKMLIDGVEKHAKEIGCCLVELVTYEHRRSSGTHRFYHKLGYKDQNEAGITYFCKHL